MSESKDDLSLFGHVADWFINFIWLHVLALFGLQIWGWLYHGVWVSIPLSAIFVPIQSFYIHLTGSVNFDIANLIPTIESGFSYWLKYPSSWIGVNKIVKPVLDFLPLVLIEVLFAIVLTFVCSYIESEIQAAEEKKIKGSSEDGADAS